VEKASKANQAAKSSAKAAGMETHTHKDGVPCKKCAARLLKQKKKIAK
jgi:hypothetical protein